MSSALTHPSTTELAECGWRTELLEQPDGTMIEVKIPLTEFEFLHPQEGYRLLNSTFHEQARSDVRDMLTRRYRNASDTAVFSDLIIKWGIPNLGNHCPDVCVVFGIKNKEQNRTAFEVVSEGVRPSLLVEVVSPRYRKADRETKVKEYSQASVQEYIIIDQRKQRSQVIEEVIGYRLLEGSYIPITPDEEGWVLCDTVGVKISLDQGQVLMEDATTGEKLLTSSQLEEKLDDTQQQLDDTLKF